MTYKLAVLPTHVTFLTSYVFVLYLTQFVSVIPKKTFKNALNAFSCEELFPKEYCIEMGENVKTNRVWKVDFFNGCTCFDYLEIF